MDFELRSVLLIVGVIVIAAILLHGLFSIRQSNKPVDISHLDLTETDGDGNPIRDGSGFDRHGVGVAKVVKTEDVLEASAAPETQLSKDQQAQTNEPSAIDSSINFDVALDDDCSEKSFNERIVTGPIFASPVAKEKEDFLAVKVTAPQVDTTQEVTVDIDDAPNLGTLDNINETTTNNEPTSLTNEPTEPQEPMDVLVLNVVSEEGTELDGASLLPLLLTLGFKFGDMNIFHRHVDAAGQGAVLFSLANMVKPGVFDIDNMEQFTTTGISLFMTLPHDNGNMETFNMMLNAAAKIAEEFNGQVLDGNRSTLTKQSTQLYVQRIRDIERKLLLVK